MTRDLRNYLAEPHPRHLHYGRHDCLTFVTAWLQRATGRDLLEGQRYTSLRDGQQKLAAHGLGDHIDLLARALPEIPVLQGRAGDIAVLPGDRRPALGIVAPGGEHVAALTPRGRALMPLTRATRMFRSR